MLFKEEGGPPSRRCLRKSITITLCPISRDAASGWAGGDRGVHSGGALQPAAHQRLHRRWRRGCWRRGNRRAAAWREDLAPTPVRCHLRLTHLRRSFRLVAQHRHTSASRSGATTSSVGQPTANQPANQRPTVARRPTEQLSLPPRPDELLSLPPRPDQVEGERVPQHP